MRRQVLFVIGIGMWLAGELPVQAGEGPAIVVPGKTGVPVVFNGYDISYCIIEGEFGLDRPGHMAPVIYACPPLAESDEDTGPGYYPAFGRRPGYGRYEIVPPPDRRLPPPAPSFYQEWGAQSAPLPASTGQPTNVEINVDADASVRKRRVRRPHHVQGSRR